MLELHSDREICASFGLLWPVNSNNRQRGPLPLCNMWGTTALVPKLLACRGPCARCLWLIYTHLIPGRTSMAIRPW